MSTRRSLAAIFMFGLLQPLIAPATLVQAAPTRDSVRERIDSLGLEISRVDEEFNLARLELEEAERRIRDLEHEKAEADARLASLQKTTTDRAVAVYRAGLPKVFTILLDSQSLSDFQRKMSVLGSVQRWETRLVEELEIYRERSDELTASLNAEASAKRQIVETVAARRRNLEGMVADQRALLRRIEAADRPKPPPPPPAPVVVASVPSSSSAAVAVQVAYQQLGKPYRWGASGPDAYDCSGLTMYAWGKAGVSLPHSSRAQWGATKRVARSDLQPGDLLFYHSPIHHVAIYVGGGKMIHAVHAGEPVGLHPIDYVREYVGAGRPGV
ncbi:MAG: NlpC/P60 family protein [Actinomycetota bacterium]